MTSRPALYCGRFTVKTLRPCTVYLRRAVRPTAHFTVVSCFTGTHVVLLNRSSYIAAAFRRTQHAAASSVRTPWPPPPSPTLRLFWPSRVISIPWRHARTLHYRHFADTGHPHPPHPPCIMICLARAPYQRGVYTTTNSMHSRRTLVPAGTVAVAGWWAKYIMISASRHSIACPPSWAPTSWPSSHVGIRA